MGVDEVGVPGGAAQGSAHRAEDDRRKPGLLSETGHDARVAAEPAVALRPDDGNLDAARLELLDEVGDEAPGEVALAARIRRREDGDLQLAGDPMSLLGRLALKLTYRVTRVQAPPDRVSSIRADRPG